MIANMKILTTILLTFMLLAGYCQEPRILKYYSPEDLKQSNLRVIDSMTVVCNSKLDSLQQLLTLANSSCDEKDLIIDSAYSVINKKDSIIYVRDAMIEIYQSPIIVADTFNIKIKDLNYGFDITLKKVDQNVWYDLVYGNMRLNADFFNLKSSTMIMDSLKTVTSSFQP